jgi:hypothetical protein
MDMHDIAYFSRREREERQHAARASDTSARRVHLEMADRYLAILRTGARQTGAGVVRIVSTLTNSAELSLPNARLQSVSISLRQ